MNPELVTQLEAERTRRSPRALAVSALGPLTVIAGIGWVALQPHRLTVLDPDGRSVWHLLIEPPLLVVLVGVLFALLVAPGLVEDIAEAEEG
jgi:hypothetical protein